MSHDHTNHVMHQMTGHANHQIASDMPVEHDMGHAMAFHFGSMETILFKFWMPEGPAGMFLSCVIVVAMCFVMETIRWLRTYRNAQSAMTEMVPPEERLRLSPRFSASQLMDSLLHLLQLALSYSLMLIFMTFNVSLCIAVLIGEVGARLMYTILFPYLDQGVGSGCG